MTPPLLQGADGLAEFSEALDEAAFEGIDRRDRQEIDGLRIEYEYPCR
jgi:hypothetical protein